MPSKAIVGKSFHGSGFHSPPVRWWVESREMVGGIWWKIQSFHSPPVRWWVESLPGLVPPYLKAVVSTALPLGGGLKGPVNIEGARIQCFHSPPVRWWVERIITSLMMIFKEVSTALPLGGGLKAITTWKKINLHRSFHSPPVRWWVESGRQNILAVKVRQFPQPSRSMVG